MKTLVIFSDAHTNHWMGLCKPNVKIGDGDTLSSGMVRRWVWNTFEDILDEVCKRKVGELWTVLNGDMVEADTKQRSGQLISRDVTEIVEMAHDVWSPVAEMSKGMYVVRGTEAHVGLNATVEESFAGQFDNVVENPETGKKTWWYLPLKFEGWKMDIMHHPQGGSGGRPQNSQGVVDRLASDTMFRAINEGYDVPDIAVRSHLHGYKNSGNAFRVQALITPALCLLSAYGHRIGLSHDGELGGILIFCDSSAYEIHPILRKPRQQKWQVIK